MAAKTLPDDEIDLDDIQKLEKFCERYPDVADEARMRWLIFCRDSNGLAAKLARLEAKLTALEHKKVFCRGVWDGSETYTEGDFATQAGSLWHCNVATSRSRPGTDDSWQLAVKRGRA